MILLCGIPSEPPVKLAIEAAERRGLETVVVNQRHGIALDIAIDLSRDQVDGTLWAWEREWRLGEVTGVYNRMIDPTELPEFRAIQRRNIDWNALTKLEAFDRLLLTWMEISPSRIACRASAITSNVSKPYQSQLIAHVGFLTPPTLVTNDPEEVKRFARHYKRVIYKSVSSVRSIVRELGAGDRLLLDRVRNLPTQFQAYISGDNVRVHVVGSRIFATEIESEAIDYRYTARDQEPQAKMRPAKLCRALKDRCRALSQRLALPFCGIDFRRTAKGDYYCLEVNPCPAYSYYEESTGQPIADALVSYLAGTNRYCHRSI